MFRTEARRLRLGLALLVAAAAARADETIVFLRHGEKPPGGLGQLSCVGLRRALALPDVLAAKFGRPDFIFAPDPGQEISDPVGPDYYVRPLITIEPLAIRLGLPVDTRFGYREIAALDRELAAPQYRNALVLVCWEHGYEVGAARGLMREFGADARFVPKWGGEDYDALYILRIHRPAGRAPWISFSLGHEGLNGRRESCPPPPSAAQAGGEVETLVGLRHGERSAAGLGQLSPQGLARALALPAVLTARFGRPDFIFAPDPSEEMTEQGVAHCYVRPLMTIAPTAILDRRPMLTPFGFTRIDDLRRELERPRYRRAVVFIAWEHEQLARFMRNVLAAHGGDPRQVPEWPGSDFDRLDVLRIERRADGTSSARFAVEAEGLNPKS